MNKRMNALKFALENEQKERDFYLANARRTKNMAGKNMFKQIADEEKEHYEVLKKLHDQWEKKKKWPATVPLKVKKSLASSILKSMSGKKLPASPVMKMTGKRFVPQLILKQGVWRFILNWKRGAPIPRRRLFLI